MPLPGPALRPVLARFAGLPAAERFHVWSRALSCPMERVAREVPRGRILDLGCGHGLFSALLAQDPARTVEGIDPDPRKIRFARYVERPPRLTFAVGGLEQVAGAPYDAVAILDVLYLVRREAWPEVLSSCAAMLNPGGRLVLKEVVTEPRWKYAKAWLQEVVMVRLLGRTHGEGLTLVPLEELAGLVERCGLHVRTADLSSGSTTPHALVVGTA